MKHRFSLKLENKTKFINPGEEILIDKGIKKQMALGMARGAGGNDKPFGSWGQNLQEPGTCFCEACCAQRSFYTPRTAKKVICRHEGDSGHKAAVCALQHTVVCREQRPQWT